MLAQILQANSPGVVTSYSEGSRGMTIKCFWCGAINDKDADVCSSCRRKLEWSNFLKAILRPSVGCLLGEQDDHAPEPAAAASTPLAVH